jgi:hypothetical protein
MKFETSQAESLRRHLAGVFDLRQAASLLTIESRKIEEQQASSLLYFPEEKRK